MFDRDPQRAGVFGNLLFNAASAAVLAGRPARAADLLAEAEAAAVRTNADFANEAAIFGPRVTGIQRVDHAVRTGDPERALHLADTMESTEGKAPAFWEAGTTSVSPQLRPTSAKTVVLSPPLRTCVRAGARLGSGPTSSPDPTN